MHAAVAVTHAAAARPLHGTFKCDHVVVSFKTNALQTIVYFRVTSSEPDSADVGFGITLVAQDGRQREIPWGQGPDIDPLAPGRPYDMRPIDAGFKGMPLKEIRVAPISVSYATPHALHSMQNLYCLMTDESIP